MNYKTITLQILASIPFSVHASDICLDSTLTYEQWTSALTDSYEYYTEPQQGDWSGWLELSARTLGCSFIGEVLRADGFEDRVERPLSQIGENNTPHHLVDYCGPESSASNAWLTLFTGSVSAHLNALCANHDQCYGNSCVSRLCNFSTGDLEASECDQPVVNYCTSSALLTAPPNDLIVCAAIAVLRNNALQPNISRAIACAPRNCNVSDGQVCLVGGSGNCVNAIERNWGVTCYKTQRLVLNTGAIAYNVFWGWVHLAAPYPETTFAQAQALSIAALPPACGAAHPSCVGETTRGLGDVINDAPLNASCFEQPTNVIVPD